MKHAWFQQAESDLEAANVLCIAGHHAQAVWLASQAVEKAHKAILAALGLRYEERHYKYLGHDTEGIAKLLPQALHEPMDPRIGEMLTGLARRAEASRYPAPVSGETAGLVAPAGRFADSRKDIEDARALLEWCRDRVTRAERAAIALQPGPGSP